MDAGAWGVIVTAILMFGGTAITLYSSRRSSNAVATKEEVAAELTRVDVQRGQLNLGREIVEYMGQQNGRYLELQAEDARKGRILEATIEAIERHEDWDKEILRAMRLMSRKLSEAGLGDVYVPRDPPPLTKHIRDVERDMEADVP